MPQDSSGREINLMEKGDNKMDKIKFGVIGCGTVAGYGHVPAIAKPEKRQNYLR